jgi:hypothetical protein
LAIDLIKWASFALSAILLVSMDSWTGRGACDNSQPGEDHRSSRPAGKIAPQADDPKVAELPAQRRVSDPPVFSYRANYARDIPEPHRELAILNNTTTLHYVLHARPRVLDFPPSLSDGHLGIFKPIRREERAELKKEPKSERYLYYGHPYPAHYLYLLAIYNRLRTEHPNNPNYTIAKSPPGSQ